ELDLRREVRDRNRAGRMRGKFLQNAKPEAGLGISQEGRSQELVGPALELHQLADAPKAPGLAVLRLLLDPALRSQRQPRPVLLEVEAPHCGAVVGCYCH